MRVRIKDTDRNPMWALQETNIHLSFESNEYLNIDLSNLTRPHQEILWLNVANGVLDTPDVKELEDVLFPKKEEVVSPPVVLNRGKQAVESVEKAKKVKELLANNVATIRKSLPQLNLANLNMVYNLEQHGKNRKTILNLVKECKKKLIEKEEKNVSDIVNTVSKGGNNNYLKHQLFKGREKAYLDNITDIEESEEHEIIIHIGEESNGEEPDSS